MRRIIEVSRAAALTAADRGVGAVPANARRAAASARGVAAVILLTVAGCAAPDTESARRSAEDAVTVAPTTADAPIADAATPAADAASAGVQRVVFVGTSLTAGYGIGADRAFPALIQQRIDAEGYPFRVVNAGLSGETSAGGLRRIDWVLQQPVDVLVLELGANDGLRGVSPDEMHRNLDAILTRTRDRYPDAALVILGMEAPPNFGTAYTSRFRDVFTELSRTHDATLLPFLLDGVAGEPSLNIEDGIHPNEEGHRRIAAHIWPVLEPVLRERVGADAE